MTPARWRRACGYATATRLPTARHRGVVPPLHRAVTMTRMAVRTTRVGTPVAAVDDAMELSLSSVLSALLPGITARRDRVALRAAAALACPRLRVEHPQRLVAQQPPCLVVANHLNKVEAIAVPATLMLVRGGHVSFVADWTAALYPGMAWYLRRSRALLSWRTPSRWGVGRRARGPRPPAFVGPGPGRGRARGGRCGGFLPRGHPQPLPPPPAAATHGCRTVGAGDRRAGAARRRRPRRQGRGSPRLRVAAAHHPGRCTDRVPPRRPDRSVRRPAPRSCTPWPTCRASSRLDPHSHRTNRGGCHERHRDRSCRQRRRPTRRAPGVCCDRRGREGMVPAGRRPVRRRR